MTVKLSPLDNVVVFSLGSISLWSGRARMLPEDFGLNSVDLPPAAVASLGSKRLISAEVLIELEKVKRKMHRLCGSTGVKFLNGYAVGVDRAEALGKQLDLLVVEGNRLRQDLLDNFEEILKKWHLENPDWAHILKAGTPEKESVHKRINFGWDAFMVRPPENDAIARSLLGASASLGSSLYGEIAAEAHDFVSKSLKPGREKGSQRTAAPIRRLVEKMRGLQFLDHRIASLTKVFDQIVGTIPSTGAIEGQSYLAMLRCAYVLADVGEMQKLGERAFNGERTDDLCAEILGSDAKQASTPVDAAATVAATAPDNTIGASQSGELAVSAEELFNEAAPAAAPAVAADGGATKATPALPPLADDRPVLHMGPLKSTKKVALPSLPPVAASQKPTRVAMTAIDF